VNVNSLYRVYMLVYLYDLFRDNFSVNDSVVLYWGIVSNNLLLYFSLVEMLYSLVSRAGQRSISRDYTMIFNFSSDFSSMDVFVNSNNLLRMNDFLVDFALSYGSDVLVDLFNVSFMHVLFNNFSFLSFVMFVNINFLYWMYVLVYLYDLFRNDFSFNNSVVLNRRIVSNNLLLYFSLVEMLYSLVSRVGQRSISRNYTMIFNFSSYFSSVYILMDLYNLFRVNYSLVYFLVSLRA